MRTASNSTAAIVRGGPEPSFSMQARVPVATSARKTSSSVGGVTSTEMSMPLSRSPGLFGVERFLKPGFQHPSTLGRDGRSHRQRLGVLAMSRDVPMVAERVFDARLAVAIVLVGGLVERRGK